MNSDQASTSCDIQSAGKSRNGQSRYWCRAHKAPATGRYGAKLERCESAHLHRENLKTYTLEPQKFRGGVAAWGALPPVYDTTGLPVERGIHVHAREVAEGKKVIDQTYDAVQILRPDLYRPSPVFVTAEAGVNYFISKFLKRRIDHLFCTYCGELHLDADYYAVHPHKKHLCHGCGKTFPVAERSISNPVAFLREQFGDMDTHRHVRHAQKNLSIRQRDYSGGIQIWASNPALLWTAGKAESEGIHVHAYKNGNREKDDTYREVIIDGISIDEEPLRYLMAQKALSYLGNKVISLKCPKCSAPIFDKGELAFTPHKDHECNSCGSHFDTPGQRKLVVSNPFIETIERLHRAQKTQRAVRSGRV